MSQPLAFFADANPGHEPQEPLRHRADAPICRRRWFRPGLAFDEYRALCGGRRGLVFVESTKVDRRGCGTIGDLGLWKDEHIPGHKRLADTIRNYGAVPAIQLGHSGRKARRFRPWEGGKPLTQEAAEAEGLKDWDKWNLVSASSLANPGDPEPHGLTKAEVQDLVKMWGQGVRRSEEAGYEALELHGAHGYLVHQFLSPSSNARNDEYGGSEENRRRFLMEIVEETRLYWPEDKPLFLRLSVQDDAGFGPDESVNVAKAVGPMGVDVIDCSSGGMRGSPVISAGPVSYGYQVPYAERLKRDGGVMSMAVGLIVHADQAEGYSAKWPGGPDRDCARGHVQSELAHGRRDQAWR